MDHKSLLLVSKKYYLEKLHSSFLINHYSEQTMLFSLTKQLLKNNLLFKVTFKIYVRFNNTIRTNMKILAALVVRVFFCPQDYSANIKTEDYEGPLFWPFYVLFAFMKNKTHG